jgi:hypothetical protein
VLLEDFLTYAGVASLPTFLPDLPIPVPIQSIALTVWNRNHSLPSVSLNLPRVRFSFNISRKLPRYPTMLVVRMERLAVDKAYKDREISGTVWANALDRVPFRNRGICENG